MSLRPAAARILDLAHLGRQTFGDRGLEREVLALFEAQCDRILPLIGLAEPLQQRLDAVHTLKGAARAIGAWKVAALCETLETALDEGREAQTRRRLGGELERAVGETRAAIAERSLAPAA
jgi:HPt (histidine-containing phosphotransfer) domain-containing protein